MCSAVCRLLHIYTCITIHMYSMVTHSTYTYGDTITYAYGYSGIVCNTASVNCQSVHMRRVLLLGPERTVDDGNGTPVSKLMAARCHELFTGNGSLAADIVQLPSDGSGSEHPKLMSCYMAHAVVLSDVASRAPAGQTAWPSCRPAHFGAVRERYSRGDRHCGIGPRRNLGASWKAVQRRCCLRPAY
jgi:hypothetical protein